MRIGSWSWRAVARAGARRTPPLPPRAEATERYGPLEAARAHEPGEVVVAERQGERDTFRHRHGEHAGGRPGAQIGGNRGHGPSIPTAPPARVRLPTGARVGLDSTGGSARRLRLAGAVPRGVTSVRPSFPFAAYDGSRRVVRVVL